MKNTPLQGLGLAAGFTVAASGIACTESKTTTLPHGSRTTSTEPLEAADRTPVTWKEQQELVKRVRRLTHTAFTNIPNIRSNEWSHFVFANNEDVHNVLHVPDASSPQNIAITSRHLAYSVLDERRWFLFAGKTTAVFNGVNDISVHECRWHDDGSGIKFVKIKENGKWRYYADGPQTHQPIPEGESVENMSHQDALNECQDLLEEQEGVLSSIS